MELTEAVARWLVCEWGESDHCRDSCKNFMYVDPRTFGERGKGPGPKGQRTLCMLLNDLRDQLKKK